MSFERSKELLKKAGLLEEKEGAEREKELRTVNNLTNSGLRYSRLSANSLPDPGSVLHEGLSTLHEAKLLTGERADLLIHLFKGARGTPAEWFNSLIALLQHPSMLNDEKGAMRADNFLTDQERIYIFNGFPDLLTNKEKYSPAIMVFATESHENLRLLNRGLKNLKESKLDVGEPGAARIKALAAHAAEANTLSECICYLNSRNQLTPAREAVLIEQVKDAPAISSVLIHALPLFANTSQGTKNCDLLFMALSVPGVIGKLNEIVRARGLRGLSQAEFDDFIKAHKKNVRTAFEMGFHARLGEKSQVKKLAGSRALVREIFNFFEPKKDARSTVNTPEVPDFKKS